MNCEIWRPTIKWAHGIKDCSVYLAAPFFNEEQRMVCTEVENLCGAQGRPLLSPRNICLLPQPCTPWQQRATFDTNLQCISQAGVVLARIDDFDPGTIWEVGYAYALGQPVVAFTTVPDRGLNVMLAQSCVGIIQGMEKVHRFLRAEAMPGFDWSAVTVWQGEVV
jgi:nucleoside deoxyribosyltransferase